MTTITDVRADLLAEQNALDDAISDLRAEQWATPTASPRWSIADQIAHLAYFDNTASIAISDPEAFAGYVEVLAASAADDLQLDEATLGTYRSMSPAELLDAWRADRQSLADASVTLADDDRVIWYGPSMGAKSFLTARLMECWAHGQDVLDAAGLAVPATDRLAHIARLGFITRGWTYLNRKLDMPDVDVSLELTAPSGATWNYGSADAAESVRGDAEDFCMVVTQRRHVDDTNLVVTGDAARHWMLIAQAFAGAPTNGPSAT